ncbi:SDR family NAD(P)-dependent oxidoreductase [Streptomyces lydicus]|uniref:SDR family NAD(P)-dependent oxidoreductase n=1 Tax=Streptomyces lydicus TaxID=47763 RepID=UPI0034497132
MPGAAPKRADTWTHGAYEPARRRPGRPATPTRVRDRGPPHRKEHPLHALRRVRGGRGGHDRHTAHWIAADVGDREALARGADEMVRRHGEPDILVNAAGVNPRPPMDELTTPDWDRTMAVNLDAPFLLGQRFGPGMAARGWGRILHIASQQAIRAFGNSGAYGVSKAGLAALTRSQAESWSRHGVSVNALAPGFVRTPLDEAVFADPDRTEAMARRTMAGRNGEPADFAGAAVFLTGPGAAYVTGQTVIVDGGFSVT